MKVYGLIGFPLSHSFSKQYFARKFEEEKISDCHYELFPISAIQQLETLLASQPDLCGLNVTIPYKEQVLPFLDQPDSVVSKIKACNCIRIESGRLLGFNTDVVGFEMALREKLKEEHRRALILGTGGAAKAVEYVLAKLGIGFHYVSRKPSVQQFSYTQLTEKIMRDHLLVINTTPLGMYPAIQEAPPIPYEALTRDHYLFDLVYNPAKTLFLQKAEEKGAAIKNGHEMLVIQAEESWKIWNKN